ncbi:MAG: adenylate/guanylate cyclase domain-containing protein, partial [Gammaproteobacteria bacterium]|nr:adenylate/guanylate cyclase domain-containing protein [Gammaproteobacteria bacterium]
FQGDAILATFNVPIADANHARNAVHAALEMLNTVATSEYVGVKLNIRIGINTGQVVAGAIGARGRLNYTVHGDAVNLAARLEALNKEYATRLMISESSAASIDDVQLSRVGEATVRGQTRSIALYTVDPATTKQ